MAQFEHKGRTYEVDYEALCRLTRIVVPPVTPDAPNVLLIFRGAVHDTPPEKLLQEQLETWRNVTYPHIPPAEYAKIINAALAKLVVDN